MKAAIDKGDWDTVKKFFEEYASKVNPEADVIFTDSYVNNNYYRPMKVLAGSFAERAVSAKQTALVEQEVAFEGAMKGLLNCVQDLPGEGFFAAPIKMPTGAARTKLVRPSRNG